MGMPRQGKLPTKVSAESLVLGDVAVQISTTMPGDSSKSADWNTGFRAGVREELAL
jgi:hypothetical protein